MGSGGAFSGTTTQQVIIDNATAATSTNTGALQVLNGGVGIGGGLFIGKTVGINTTSTTAYLNIATPSNSTTPALTIGSLGNTNTVLVDAGGNISLNAAFNNFVGASLNLTSGGGGNSAFGGDLNIISGSVGNAGTAGNLNITGGPAGNSGTGGGIVIRGGATGNAGQGGHVYISGGSGGNGSGGNLYLSGWISQYGPDYSGNVYVTGTNFIVQTKVATYSTNTGALQVAGGVGVGGGIYAGGVVTATNFVSGGLTSGRVTYAGTNGLLQDSNNLTFDGTNLTCLGNITASSDATMKKDIETIVDALNKVTAMRGVTFIRIGDNIKGVGVVAQELQEIAPELVVTDESGTLSVAYGNITGYLIEAVKELTARVKSLENQLGQQ